MLASSEGPQVRAVDPAAIEACVHEHFDLRPAAILRDHATGECVAVAETTHGEMLDTLEADCGLARDMPDLNAWRPPDAIAEDDPARFIAGVERVYAYFDGSEATFLALQSAGRGKQAAATREDDFIERLFVAHSHDYLLCFSNRGKLYWLKVFEVPAGSRAPTLTSRTARAGSAFIGRGRRRRARRPAHRRHRH